MADLTATDVTVNLDIAEGIDRSPDKEIRTYPSISFGDGVLTYPTGGIPLPPKEKFGFNFNIKRAYVEQPADGYVYSIDRANHTLRIFQSAAQTGDAADAAPLAELGQVAVAATALDLEMIGR